MPLDGQRVRLIYDVFDEGDGELLAPAGTKFVWSNDGDCQHIPGYGLIFIEEEEVELTS